CLKRSKRRQRSAAIQTAIYCPRKPRIASISTAVMWVSARRRANSGRPRPIRWRRISDARGGLLPLSLQPEFQHLRRHCTVVFAGTGERLVIALLDPGFVRGCCVARESHPHQATRLLRWKPVAVEQHLAEHGLRLVLPLLCREPKPARTIGELVRR